MEEGEERRTDKLTVGISLLGDLGERIHAYGLASSAKSSWPAHLASCSCCGRTGPEVSVVISSRHPNGAEVLMASL